MESEVKKRSTIVWFSKPVVASCIIFTTTWFLTLFINRILWKSDLPDISPLEYSTGFLIPLLVVIIFSITFTKDRDKNNSLQYIYILVFIIFFINIVFFHFLHVRIYGDYGQLSTDIAKGIVFPRWLIGSSILEFLYQSIALPVYRNFEANAFIRISGCFLMCLFSFFVLRKYPNRLTVLLPLSTPIWFLLSSGYNEYYPFITPIFLFSLLLLSEDIINKLSPVFMGIIASLIILIYAGFVPIGLFLLFVYGMKRGISKGIYAILYSTISFFLLVLIFWPSPYFDFFRQYYIALNIKESTLYPSMLMEKTPFFKVSYAFAAENIRRMLNSFYWAGGFASIFLLLITVLFRKLITKDDWKRRNLFYILLILCWHIFYFIFMVPRLGAFQDIDLFFNVYITFAFAAGLFADIIINNIRVDLQPKYKSIVYSFFLGNISCLILFFVFYGIPYF